MEGFDENVWKIAQELGVNERHFNQMQHQYRAMASGWMLAIFAGVQFVLANWGKLPFPSELILTLIGFAGAIGITQLWNLDLRVYHQLLDACFVQGLQLEQKYNWLPKIRTSMLQTQGSKKKGVLARVVWFYLIGVSVALLIAVTGTLLAVDSLTDYSMRGLLAVAVIDVLWVYLWMLEIVRGTQSPLLEKQSNAKPVHSNHTRSSAQSHVGRRRRYRPKQSS
jgi:hypothetical protein